MAIKEMAVLLGGTVADIEQLFAYDNKTQQSTSTPDGVRVTLLPLVPGDGFAQVKIAQADLEKARPVAGQSVVWVVRYGAWSRNDNAATTCRWIRSVDDDYLGRVNGAYTNGKKSAA